MRLSLSAAAVIALPITTMASTLNDWEPRIANLSAGCKAVYTSDINGCSADDFQNGATCNAACVKGLQDVAAKVKTACGDEDFGSDTEAENILLCFLAGNGPQRVCPNNAVAQTGGLSSSSTMVAKTTTMSTTSTTSATSTTASSQSEASTSSSTTESTTESSSETTVTSTTSASPTTTILLDTSTITSSATPEPSSSQDNQGDGSGGGSPFDDASSSGGVFCIPIVTTLVAAGLLVAGLR